MADAASFKRMRPTLLIAKLRRMPHLCSIILKRVIARRLQSKFLSVKTIGYISFEMEKSIYKGSWVRPYCVDENKMMGNEFVNFHVCKVKNPENHKFPCGRALKNGPRYGTSSLLRHLKSVHPTDVEISEELRVRNIKNGQKVFHYNNLIYYYN